MARRNEFPNPRFAAGGALWSVTRCTVAQDATVTLGGVPSGKLTVSSTAGDPYCNQASAVGTFVAGQAGIGRVHVRASIPGVQGMVLLQALNSGGSLLSSSTFAYSAISATEWTTLTGTMATLPANTSYILAYVRLQAASVAVGTLVHIVQPMLDPAGGSYGDGELPGWDWTATPHNSASIFVGLPPQSVLTIGSSHVGPLRVGKD